MLTEQQLLDSKDAIATLFANGIMNINEVQTLAQRMDSSSPSGNLVQADGIGGVIIYSLTEVTQGGGGQG